ncbi:MAG: tectonin domain-containing protein [Planctomycetota bacterium]
MSGMPPEGYDAGRLDLSLEVLEPRILLSVPAGAESLLGAEWSAGTRSAPSVPFTDNFNDNSQGALWGLLEDAPTEVWLAETQGRLELRSDGSSSQMQGSFYVGNAWALDTWNDFAFRADWDFTAGGGGAGALDLTIVAAPPQGFCSLGLLAGADGSVDFAMASGETFGQEDIEDAVERDVDSGTVYVSYDTSADRLSLSGNGYWRTQHNPTNGDWVYQGKVWGEWGAETVGVALGGIASGMTLGAGDAYLDDLTVDQGTVVAPIPQSVPYTQDFSVGRPHMGQGWGFFECEGGRVQVTGGRLRMDDVSDDMVYSLCEGVLHLDLAGATGVTLTLDHWSLGDENDSLPATFTGHAFGDGIAVSADGLEWHRVTSLTSDFTQQSFDLDAVVQAAGISYTSDFQIKFQQYDNYSASMDGREFDNITVSIGPVADDLVWGLNDAGGVFVRTGISESDQTGSAWTRVPGKLDQVSAGEASVWGINPAGGIFVRDGVARSAPQGTAWTRVSGSLR